MKCCWTFTTFLKGFKLDGMAIDLQCLCVVFFESYISNVCDTPDLTISIQLVMGVRVGSAVVSVFCFFNTGLLSVQHSDSVPCISVCILSFPHILHTLHVLTDFFSLGLPIVADDSEIFLLSIMLSNPHWFECCPC